MLTFVTNIKFCIWAHFTYFNSYLGNPLLGKAYVYEVTALWTAIIWKKLWFIIVSLMFNADM